MEQESLEQDFLLLNFTQKKISTLDKYSHYSY